MHRGTPRWTLPAWLCILWREWVCVANGYPASVAGPLWSVSIEEQFYFAWPLLLSIFSCRRLPHLALVCLCIATGMRLFVVRMSLPHPSIWCNTFARLDPIALGALYALFCHRREYVISNGIRFLLFTMGVIVPPALIFVFGDSCWEGTASLLFYPVIAICCVLILASFYRFGEKPTHRRSGILAIIVYFGRISYGLYVFHELGIQVARRLIATDRANGLVETVGLFVIQFVISFGFTLGLASCSYAFLEKPFLRLKERFTYVGSDSSKLKPLHELMLR